MHQLWLQTTTSCPAASDAHANHPLLDSEHKSLPPSDQPAATTRQRHEEAPTARLRRAGGGGSPLHTNTTNKSKAATLSRVPVQHKRVCTGTKKHLLFVVRSSLLLSPSRKHNRAKPTNHRLHQHSVQACNPHTMVGATAAAFCSCTRACVQVQLLQHCRYLPASCHTSSHGRDRPCCCLLLAAQHATPPHAAFAVGYCHMCVSSPAATPTADLVTALRPCCCRLLVRGSSGLIHTQSRRSGQAGRCA